MKLRTLSILLLSTFFIGCTQSQNTDTQDDSLNTDTPKKVYNTVQDTDIALVSKNAVLETRRIDKALDINPSVVSDFNASTSTFVLSDTSLTLDESTPLFIDGEFKGLVDSIDENNVVTLKDAESITDVYKSFDLSYEADEVAQALTRSVAQASSQKKIGKYDYMNSDSLSAYVYRKKDPLQRGLNNNPENLIMHIDIPQGYEIPLEAKSNPDLRLFSVEKEVSITDSNHIDYPLIEDKNSVIKFTSKGSYIEYSVGATIRAKYQVNATTANEYAFSFSFGSELASNLQFEITGDGELKKDYLFELTKVLSIPLRSPNFPAATVYLNFQPKFQYLFDGEAHGRIFMANYIKKNGSINIEYDNQSGLKHTVTNNSEEKNSFELDLNVTANTTLYPYLDIKPSIKISGIKRAISFGDFQTGVKLSTDAHGVIHTGFEVINTSVIKSALDAEAYIETDFYALVNATINFMIGTESIYAQEAQNLYTSDPKRIFDWHIQLLETPMINTQVNLDDFQSFYVGFSNIESNTTIKNNLEYHYTLTDLETNTKTEKIWDGESFLISKPTKISLRTVLKNKDISNGEWSFGSSYSFEVEKVLEKFTDLNYEKFPITLDVCTEQYFTTKVTLDNLTCPKDNTKVVSEDGSKIECVYNELIGTAPYQISQEYRNTIYLKTLNYESFYKVIAINDMWVSAPIRLITYDSNDGTIKTDSRLSLQSTGGVEVLKIEYSNDDTKMTCSTPLPYETAYSSTIVPVVTAMTTTNKDNLMTNNITYFIYLDPTSFNKNDYKLKQAWHDNGILGYQEAYVSDETESTSLGYQRWDEDGTLTSSTLQE